jgi:hypothetical protein
MAKTKKLDIDILPEGLRKELLDFYEFLVQKHSVKKKRAKNAFFESVKLHSFKLPMDYRFNREELHER